MRDVVDLPTLYRAQPLEDEEENMRIDAAVAHSGQRFVIRQLQLDEPRPDEILVRIVGVGICHTDLVFASGASAYPLPAVLGHEGSGIVKRVGAAVSKVAPGDRVAITFR